MAVRQDLVALGKKLVEQGPVKTLHTPRRVRILYNGVYIADTTSAVYVWEHEYYPYFYVPKSSVKEGVLHPSQHSNDAAFQTATLRVGDRSTDRVLIFADKGIAEKGKELEGLVRFEFGAVDAWFEEDTPIYVHPKDPFRRVDVLHSTRPIEVHVNGIVVAKAESSFHLYETGLPCRYYLPPTAVDRKLLRESDMATACPYKGIASYFDLVLDDGDKDRFKDLIWWYRSPNLECAQIAGALCFYHEKEEVEILLDGEVVRKPKTPWS
ncbi:DUF427-domain-containing protein [Hypoxylon trugodes]|uniref:DUF427-domain-containing protein n=1 Tax=Hypoxylon trugodes TaxID=326681 RepID=UPI002196F485|nr:DUF427-domain-containing protein [Hypoxylon trugodes]KAI1385535.1 DUF427-domain-containing protein [Hypoxylon trugodes]